MLHSQKACGTTAGADGERGGARRQTLFDSEIMKHPRVYIILVNYNGWKETIECLESVLRLDYPNFQVIVVDNASADDSMAHILSWAQGRQSAGAGNHRLARLTNPPLKKPVSYVLYESEPAPDAISRHKKDGVHSLIMIQSGENRGFAAGNNIGIRYATARNDATYIWLLNNDTVVEADALSVLVKKAGEYEKKRQKVGMIGAKLLYYDSPDRIQGVAGLYNKWFARTKHLGSLEVDRGQYDNETVAGKMDYPIGASLFVSTDFIKDVGRMCEDYFLYFEELDWAVRGAAKGWQLGYCWQATVYHKEGRSAGASSTKPQEKSTIADFYSIRNRILISKKYYPLQLWSVKLSFILVIINRLRRRQFDRLRWISSRLKL